MGLAPPPISGSEEAGCPCPLVPTTVMASLSASLRRHYTLRVYSAVTLHTVETRRWGGQRSSGHRDCSPRSSVVCKPRADLWEREGRVLTSIGEKPAPAMSGETSHPTDGLWGQNERGLFHSQQGDQTRGCRHGSRTRLRPGECSQHTCASATAVPRAGTDLPCWHLTGT